jgi:hypothetical protein
VLLNRLPCLDKGYVALVAASCGTKVLNEAARELFKKEDSKFLRELGHMTILMRCPLFVQLHLSTFDFKVVSVPTDIAVEAYIPNVGEVGAPSTVGGQEMVDNMKATTDALLINPAAYQRDGCDRFTSQVLTPISTYTTLIVQGSYNEWKRFCEQQRLPSAIKAYVRAVTQIANVEWY